MKNIVKISLLGVILAVALLLGSCEKGGTIEVTNKLTTTTWINILEGGDVKGSFAQGEGTAINAGETHKFTFTEDGTYTVFAVPPLDKIFYKVVILIAGSTEKVVVE